MRFDTNNIQTTFVPPVTKTTPINSRKYTLTHSDDTGEMFLTIANEYDYKAINKELRDEVLGVWKIYDKEYILFFYVHVGDYNYEESLKRYNIFKQHMKSALQAIFYGDIELLTNNPNLYDTPIYIKFDSYIPLFNNYEFYGYVSNYITN